MSNNSTPQDSESVNEQFKAAITKMVNEWARDNRIVAQELIGGTYQVAVSFFSQRQFEMGDFPGSELASSLDVRFELANGSEDIRRVSVFADLLEHVTPAPAGEDNTMTHYVYNATSGQASKIVFTPDVEHDSTERKLFNSAVHEFCGKTAMAVQGIDALGSGSTDATVPFGTSEPVLQQGRIHLELALNKVFVAAEARPADKNDTEPSP